MFKKYIFIIYILNISYIHISLNMFFRNSVISFIMFYLFKDTKIILPARNNYFQKCCLLHLVSYMYR